MSAIDPRLKKRIAGLEARQAEFVSASQERQHELQAVLRDLHDLRRAVAVVEGTDGVSPSTPISSPAGTSFGMSNVMRALDAVRRLEVGSVGFQAVRILSAAGKPLHGGEIAAQLEAMTYLVRSHTVGVTLGRMARAGRVVRKVAPNTYALDGGLVIGNAPFSLEDASEFSTEPGTGQPRRSGPRARGTAQAAGAKQTGTRRRPTARAKRGTGRVAANARSKDR